MPYPDFMKQVCKRWKHVFKISRSFGMIDGRIINNYNRSASGPTDKNQKNQRVSSVLMRMTNYRLRIYLNPCSHYRRRITLVWHIVFFPSHAYLRQRPKVQKGIDKGKKSTRYWKRCLVGWKYWCALTAVNLKMQLQLWDNCFRWFHGLQSLL